MSSDHEDVNVTRRKRALMLIEQLIEQEKDKCGDKESFDNKEGGKEISSVMD